MAKNDTTSTKALISGLLGALLVAGTAVQAALGTESGLDQAAVARIVLAFFVAAATTATTYLVPNALKVSTVGDPAPERVAPAEPAEDEPEGDGSAEDLAEEAGADAAPVA